MFSFFKKKETPRKPIEFRDTLFGDLPISEWPQDQSLRMEPWVSFLEARKHLNKPTKQFAFAALQKVLGMPGLDSRHYLQAWHFLRQIQVNPPADAAAYVLGVVVEVGMPQGTDTLAAYRDYTARYLNYTGASVIWERPDPSLDTKIEALLQAGQAAANVIGPWTQERPPAPTKENVRVSMLTPSGIRWDEGTFEYFGKLELGQPIIQAATELMQSLIAKDRRQ